MTLPPERVGGCRWKNATRCIPAGTPRCGCCVLDGLALHAPAAGEAAEAPARPWSAMGARLHPGLLQATWLTSKAVAPCPELQ